MIRALFDQAIQFEYRNGTILSGGKIYVYHRGRTELATVYSDDIGTVSANPVILNDMGMANIFVHDGYTYTMVCTDQYGKELFSLDKELAEGGSGSGSDVIINGSEYINVNRTVVAGDVVYTISLTDEAAETLENAATESYVDSQDDQVRRTINSISYDLQMQINQKQNRLTPGEHIEITDENVINVIGDFGNTYTSPEQTITIDNDEATLEATKYYMDEDVEATVFNVGGELDEIEITTDVNHWKFERTDGKGPYSVYFELPVYYGTQRVMENHRVDEATEGTYPTNAFEHEDEVDITVSFGPSIHSGKFTRYISNGVVKKEVQEKLVAGDNIGIAADGKTISVTDKKELHVASPITWDADTTTIGFDDSAYAKTSDIPTDFYTKAQTDSAISSAVADKVTTSELNTVKGTLETSIGEVESQVISVANTLSTNYYTKTQVDGFLQNWSGFVVVPLGEELPAASEAQLGKIYLWKKADAQEKDNYEEWISDGTAWSKIGSMEIDLSNYYTKTEIEENYATLGDITRVEAAVNDKLDKVEVDGITITGDGTTDNPLKATADIGETYTLEAEGPHGSGDITYIKITDDTTNKKTLLGLTDAAKQAIAAGVAKQDKLTAGDGINISNSDVISCTLPKTITWSGDDQVIIPAGKKWSGMLSIILQPSTAKGAGAYCGPRHPDNNISTLVVWPEIPENMVTGYNWYCQTIAFEYDNRNGTTDKTWEFTRSGVLAEEVHTMFVGIEE